MGCLAFLEPFWDTGRGGLLEKTSPAWMATALAKPGRATWPALSNILGMFFLLGFARAAQRHLSSCGRCLRDEGCSQDWNIGVNNSSSA